MTPITPTSKLANADPTSCSAGEQPARESDGPRACGAQRRRQFSCGFGVKHETHVELRHLDHPFAFLMLPRLKDKSAGAVASELLGLLLSEDVVGLTGEIEDGGASLAIPSDWKGSRGMAPSL